MGFTIACSVAVLALAVPNVLAAVHQHSAEAPQGWAVAQATPDEEAALSTFTLALTMQNLDQLEPLLLSVSTPGGANYGKFMTTQDLDSLFGPTDDAITSVTNWLKSSGISSFNVDGAFIDFATDITTANKVFNASYQHYSDGTATKLRTLSFSIPEDIEQHIQYLDPSTYFGTTKAFHPTTYKQAPKKVRSEGLSLERRAVANCSRTITPACLKAIYNVGNYTPAVGNSRVGFASFLNESAIFADATQFEQMNGIAPQSWKKVIIAGGVDDQNITTGSYGEANLDAQNIIGISHPLPMTEFITGGLPPFIPDIDQPAGDNQNEPYVPFYRYLLSQDEADLPQVISLSYGDIEDTVPFDYATLTCNLIGFQGLRGITILESSGDLGVGAGCLSPDNSTVEFNPIFPATCPYVTSVGGTVSVSPEIAWEGSSGGFSKYFPRPSYQEGAVREYLCKIGSSAVQYYGQYTNFKGRGFPDVAAHSVSPDYQIVAGGRESRSGGTSAASPVFAAIVALLNDARLQAGKPTLGWLNPLIYAYGPEILTDITGGRSVGCNGVNTQSEGPEPAGSGIVPWAFWNATTAWDPVTGYGTPDFGKMKDLVLSL